jgi:hypothetical protein
MIDFEIQSDSQPNLRMIPINAVVREVKRHFKSTIARRITQTREARIF